MLPVLLLAAALPASVSARSGAVRPATLVRADDAVVTFRLDVPGPVFSPSSLSGFEHIQMDGFAPMGRPGEPPVPSHPFLVAIPPGATATVTARALTSEAAGTHRLEPYPTPTLIQDDELGPVTGERLEVDEAAYRSWSPPGLAEADAPAYIRHQRVLPVRVNPVSYDPVSGEVTVATRVEVTVRISRAPRTAPTQAPARPETKEWDDIFGRLLVNPAQARQWREIRPDVGLAPDRAGTARMALPGTVKLSVRESAMHRVTASALIAAGFPAGQPIGNLRLFKPTYLEASFAESSVNIAFYVREDPAGTAGVFDGNDLLIFYGQRLRDDAGQPASAEQFSDHNVYWLEASPGTAMGTRSPAVGTVSADTATASFPASQHFETDLSLRTGTPPGNTDIYYYNVGNEAGPVDMPVDLNTVAPGASLQLSAELHGLTYTSPRLIRLSLVNSQGETVLDPGYGVPSVGRRVFTTTVPAAALVPGTNQFRLNRPDQSRSSVEVLLNWVEASYPALYRARGNALRFNTASLAGDTSVTVTGLSTNADLELFDVTQAYSPVRIALGSGHFKPVPGGYALSFRESIASREQLLLTPVSRMVQIATGDIEADTPSAIIGGAAESGVDVLVVANKLFVPQMQQWASYRRAQGYRVYIADVEDVFDEFNGGVPSPRAIFRFTRHFFELGNASALVLVGDASVDHKTVSSYSAPNLVPTNTRLDNVGSLLLNEVVATDKRYVKMPGPTGTIDAYPDLIMGRLSVGNTGELDIVLTKTLKYERPTASDFWRKRMILVADDTYSAGGSTFGGAQVCNQPVEKGFQDGQEESAQTIENSLPAGYDVRRFYLADYTKGFYTTPCANVFAAITFTRQNVTDLLLNELNQGATLVTIQAHMNRHVVAHEDLLATDPGTVLGGTGRDHLRVENRGKPWILFAMGCHFSEFATYQEHLPGIVQENNPNGDCFAEQFLFQNDRGAVATYGSTGFEYLQPNRDYLNDMTRIWFYEAPFDTMINQTQGEWKLGQLMFLTETRMVGRGQADPVDRYEIIGDPLLRIDAGPPAFDVTVDGKPVQDGGVVQSSAAGDTIQVVAVVTDENAIRDFGLEIDGADLTDSLTVVPLVDQSLPRARQYRLSFRHKLLPDTYDIILRAFQAPDTLAGRYHIAAEFKLRVASSITVAVNGRVVSSGEAVPAVGSYRVDLAFPIFIPASQIDISIDDVTIAGVTLTHPSAEDSLSWVATFQRTLGGGKHTLRVRAGTIEFTYDLQVSETAGLRDVINYPNPYRDEGTSIVYTNDVEILDGTIDIFTVSGKRVRSLVIPPNARGPGQNAVFWNGRDEAGDRLANGVYLYVIRATQRTGSATARGKMSHLE